jgi:hypothetical protein
MSFSSAPSCPTAGRIRNSRGRGKKLVTNKRILSHSSSIRCRVRRCEGCTLYRETPPSGLRSQTSESDLFLQNEHCIKKEKILPGNGCAGNYQAPSEEGSTRNGGVIRK